MYHLRSGTVRGIALTRHGKLGLLMREFFATSVPANVRGTIRNTPTSTRNDIVLNATARVDWYDMDKMLIVKPTMPAMPGHSTQDNVAVRAQCFPPYFRNNAQLEYPDMNDVNAYTNILTIRIT